MSRVEEEKDEHDREKRQPLDRTPEKAEGDENTVDEALRKQSEHDRR